MREIKVAPEVAKAEFDRWAESWVLDTDTASMKDEDRDSFEAMERRISLSIQRGDLVLNEDGLTLTYTLMFPMEGLANELTFYVPTGAALVAWDKYKDRQAMHKLNSFIGSMCKTNPAVFSKMDGRDLKIFQAVAQLFLGS